MILPPITATHLVVLFFVAFTGIFLISILPKKEKPTKEDIIPFDFWERWD